MGLCTESVCGKRDGVDVTKSVREVMVKTNIIHVPAHKTVFPSQAPVSCYTKKSEKNRKKITEIFLDFLSYFSPFFFIHYLQ